MSETFTTAAFSLNLKLPGDDRLGEQALRNRDTVLSAYRDLAAGDEAALMNILDPDVLFCQAPGLPYGGEARGIEATMRMVGEMFAWWSAVNVDVLDIAAGANSVIAHLMLDNTARATGDKYTGPTTELFSFRNGKVNEWRVIYWDTHGVRVACGL